MASVRCAEVRWPGFVQVVMRVLVVEQVGQVEPLQLQLVVELVVELVLELGLEQPQLELLGVWPALLLALIVALAVKPASRTPRMTGPCRL